MTLLSASLIVRNEESFLGSCLASLQGVVDEIVIVDTGSTDRSKEIARAAGARVYDFPWVGDFSAARNRCLDLCTGEWILYIDADEQVRPGSVVCLRDELNAPSFIGYQVLLHPRRAHSPYWIFRLFKNDPELRFRGVIHETMWPALGEYRSRHGGQVGFSRLVLDHDGYEGDQAAKNARNLPLLLKYIEQDRTRVYVWCHLAGIYASQGEDDLAEDAWSHALALVRQRGPTSPEDVMPYLGLIELGLRLNRDVNALLSEGLSLFPSNAQLLALRGRVLMRAGEFASAIPVFEDLIARGASGKYDRGTAYDFRLFGVASYESLAVCHFKLGNYAQSRRYYALAAKDRPDHLEYRVKQALCSQLEGRTADARP